MEEAIQAALEELGAKRDEVEIEVLDEGNRGFLGLWGSKEARVRVIKRDVVGEKAEKAEKLLTRLLELMGVEAEVESRREGGTAYFNIKGEHLGLVIGRRGETLDSVQYLVGLAANKEGGEWLRVIIDAEGYRKRREETLRRLAQRLASKVRAQGRKTVLEPMSAQDRRIIHLALQDDRRVQTYSEGEEPYRRVVIAPR